MCKCKNGMSFYDTVDGSTGETRSLKTVNTSGRSMRTEKASDPNFVQVDQCFHVDSTPKRIQICVHTSASKNEKK